MSKQSSNDPPSPDQTLLKEMLRWKLNVFACLPQHIEAVMDEFHSLLQELTLTIAVHSQRGYQKHGRGALLLLPEKRLLQRCLIGKFINTIDVTNQGADSYLFGMGGEKYEDSIRLLLLRRIQTYNPQSEAVVIWIAPDKIGVALWEFNKPVTRQTSNLNLEFPF